MGESAWNSSCVTSFIFLSKNKTLTKLAKKYGLRLVAARFVAGVTIAEAAKKIKEIDGYWHGYNMRRLAERPANVLFVLKGVLKK